MWNPFKQDQSTEARGASKDTQQNNDAKRKEREITAIDKGSFWTVFRYTDRKTGEVRNDLLAKKLRRHLIFPEYSSNQDPKFTKEVASYLRRERDHLYRSYSSELPDLIPKEKIITLPPIEGHPAGEIISVQEKMNDYKKLHQFNINQLDPEQQKELRAQIDTFIQITKQMAEAQDPVDPEFSNAMPDITHL
ncbi:MAG: hypothetical protein ACD_66C00139G0002 [uncultured bacterium]|uniref:Uncharacterized protein n=1 Tax=Candidatus Uhrbacteria bacterium GW2011_GWC1_41_20 TaxID=1618983 RepID=A0A0G0VK14_9BACT|nr:MAG: hypothetical protein ACD_66C00139G0002 [uncultured bacterium]KKR23216.1 MAG: hypothetical protein UT52_C0001G0009 [Candidatus Uhrbacteria bacterium GW2011_GWE1_39_46]KKR64398.1 MAG: hypothetical protein UU04_C0002G0009 [Candidatus Uhrbacteria bacterium GW2011_GWC2_40_450]KKR89840.1 MAG: hypothetical protein UU36_C0016G0003 [Candidatus Uhrbacteria bacterium GW2011_GWE2_41_1153]KKR90723.1 MAG: hypothetical protein UU40_C0001G0061 [Candidatus Uhrbacteria bacterium GW2011_GWD2_41_121]KKR96